MARISLANALTGIRNAFGPGGQLRAKDQLAAVVEALLQIAGNANIAWGNTEPADPLNSPFTIYVNPYTGSDRFVGGSYNWFEEPGESSDRSKIEAKLKRLENQRLVCGYSRQRPFRTINRAAIEIVAMTSKNFFTINSEEANVDCPSVELSPGTHIFYNDPGNSSYAIPVAEWPAAGFDPTPNHLIAFNPNSGGIVLPRYATASAPLSLRQTTVRPSYVPAAADEAADYSNRAAILKITSTSYVYGFTFRDQFRASSSHHLLDCFHNASQADLDQLYAKVRTAMGGASNSGNLSNALAVTRLSEWQTVGPISGNPSEAWDTVKGASPYIYNCSLRTEWGMSGVFWDGARLAGLKSLVAAQFTGISQQRDLSCWEIYRSGAWRAPVNYQELIDSESDDVRMKPRRMSRHITLLHDAFGQLVSVFAIGAGRHHFADSGAQMEFSNSTSNFGGCVAVAKGYQSASVALDSNWNLRRLRVARSVADQTGNIRRIPLGLVSAISGSTITLAEALAVGADPAVPAVLAAGGYSLAAGTLIWIENPNGVDWRATLSANAWSGATPTAIAITAAAAQAGTGEAIGTDGGVSLAVGRRVYVRRLIDTRSTAQRRVTLKLANTTSARVPLRNSIIQTRPGVGGGGISRALAPGGAEVLAVTQTNAIPAEGSGVVLSAEVTLRRSCPDEVYSAGVFIRQGQTVKHGGKHYTAKSNFTASGSVPNTDLWQQSYVQQESSYNAEDPTTLEGPVLIFDTDTDASSDQTATCGINWSSVYTASGSVRDQLRSATDYRGALALLLALGFTSTAAHAALVPRTEASRELDPANTTHFPTAPSGGAASERANWALEFRQPSFIQLLGHNLNGVGFWNYSRALPRARRQMSALNEFNANFAPEQGGRVEVKGINKDGYEVTNQGLVSTDTGEVVAVEGIGAEGDQSLPTQFNDIAVENLSITGTLDVSGVVALDGGESIALQTNRYGTGVLADAAALRSSSTIAGANDTELNASLNARPELVTLSGLNYWASQAGVVTRRTGVAVLYVVPDNAISGLTYNFSGVNGTLAMAPNRTGADLFYNPPTTRANAVLFLRAAEYANAIFGPEESVEYRLADGPYWNNVSFDHIANVVGALNEFPEGNVVADWTAASTRPTTNVKALHDASAPFRCPCFASAIVIGQLGTTGVWIAFALPTKLTFNQTGSMRGIGWLSTARTLSDTTNYPNSLYGTLASYRSSGISFASFVDACLNGLVPAGQELRAFGTKPAIETRNGVVGILDTFFGSQSPGRASKGFLDPYSLILISGAGGVTVSGMYLIGNVTLALSDLPLSVAKGITLSSTGTPRALGTQHSQNLIGGYDSFVNEGFTAAITFAARYRTDASSNNEWKANYDTNCIHVLDDNGYYGLMANRASSGSSRGATLDAIIGDFNAGTTLKMNGFSRSSELFSKTNQFAGVAGVFGNVSGETKGPWGLSPVASDAVLLRPGSIDNAVWRSAITGAQTTSDVTLSPSPGGAQESYTLSSSGAHNIRAQAFFRGVNINNNVTVGGTLFSNRFFA
jgi:hypothetical protein